MQFTPKQPFVGIKLQLFNNPGFIEKTGLVPIRPALLPLQKKQLDHQESSQARLRVAACAGHAHGAAMSSRPLVLEMPRVPVTAAALALGADLAP